MTDLARLPGPIRELGGAENLLPEAQMDSGSSSREFMKLMGWLTARDVEAVVSSSARLQRGQRSLKRNPFQHDLFIAPGDQGLAIQILEVSCDDCNTCRGGVDRSPELGHGCRAPSMPGAYGITNGRRKLRTHRRGRPPRVPPFAARTCRAIIPTRALCRNHQQGRSPGGTSQSILRKVARWSCIMGSER